jgi:hypothetical protein
VYLASWVLILIYLITIGPVVIILVSVVHVVTTAFVIVLTIRRYSTASQHRTGGSRPASTKWWCDAGILDHVTWFWPISSRNKVTSPPPQTWYSNLYWILSHVTWFWPINSGVWVPARDASLSNQERTLGPQDSNLDKQPILGHGTRAWPRSAVDSGSQDASINDGRRSHHAGLANQRRVNHWVKYSKSDQPTISIKFKEKADSVLNRLVWSTNCLSVC